jgi:adenine phosphoribosyltransferase
MTMNENDKKIILDSIRDVPDFPKAGIVFKDITTLLNNPSAMSLLIDHLEARYKTMNIDYIAGAESRGFLFGVPLADRLNLGFVPIRKPGKLPYTTISEKYALEYGTDEVQIHIDAFPKENARVLFIDDLIATGGTAKASVSLINKAGATCVEACFIMQLGFLNGTALIEESTPVYSVLDI